MPRKATARGTPCAAQPDTSSNTGPAIRIRCPSFLRHRYASTCRQYSAGSVIAIGVANWQYLNRQFVQSSICSLPSSMVALPDQAQPLERQIGVNALNRRALARQHVGEAAGSNHPRLGAAREFRPDAAYQPVHHLDIAEKEARLHGVDGGLADDLSRLPHVDARKPGGALEQRLGRDV